MIRVALAALTVVGGLLFYSNTAHAARIVRGAGDPTDGAPGAVPDLTPDPLPVFFTSMVESVKNFMRGERNNNPGNIRISGIDWKGEIPGDDKSFETFGDAKSGIRALAVLLRTYQNKHGLKTIQQIIDRYAPPVENDTGAYVRAVAASMGVSPDAEINVTDNATLSLLVAAIIKHENGRVIYSASEISDAVRSA